MSAPKKVIVIGGPGKAGLVSQIIEDNRRNFNDLEFEVAGYMNDYDVGKVLHGYPVLGTLDDIPRFLDQDYHFIYAIHLTERNYQTETLFHKCNLPPERMPVIISRRAFVTHTATLEPGVCVSPYAMISQNARVGQCTMVASKSFVGHDSVVGPLCHISITSVVGSMVTIGKVATIGIHATVIEHCHIGDYALLGAAALATKSIPEGQVWIGSPARYLRNIRRD
jgi:sugar O-acyltransferase (sialic acid O-acetyltransferase NeuD family)